MQKYVFSLFSKYFEYLNDSYKLINYEVSTFIKTNYN